MTNDHEDSHEFDRLKLAVDSVKHITTLATGTIVLIAAFTDRLHKPLSARGFLIAAISCMLLCLCSAFIYLWSATLSGFPQARQSALAEFLIPKKWRGKAVLLQILSDVIYFSFYMGIGLLAAFAVLNI